jgi:hypothetical protein
MILIDFQGGAHGNFLEFVCNKFLANISCNNTPFNKLGSSHNKIYYDTVAFRAGHYTGFRYENPEILDHKIISIQIDHNDLLPLSSISLLRAGDYNIDNDQLEINTYNKLNNKDYSWVLDNLIKSFFHTQIQDSYKAVKDSSWPEINSIEDFKQLPLQIQRECLDVHKLKFLQLDTQHPDCPRNVLREFFKIGFGCPEMSGFISLQKKMIYNASNDVHVFTFKNFYNTEDFVFELEQIGKWSNFSLHDLASLIRLHRDFLDQQPYKDSKKFCDKLLKRIYNQEVFEIPKLDLMQESYMTANLENYYKCELCVDRIEWYKSSLEIFEDIK